MTERCGNMNHSRSTTTVKYCPTCGVLLNPTVRVGCSVEKHNEFRKNRLSFCLGCGQKLALKR